MSFSVTGTSVSNGSVILNSNSGVYNVVYTNDLDTGHSINLGTTKDRKTGQISPALYMRYVKSKFTKTQKEKLQRRMAKLKKLIPYAQDMGQQAMYEELSKELVGILKEQEIDVLGFSRFVEYPTIDKFMQNVKDKVIRFEKFENFPRVVPKRVQDKAKKLMKTGVFDSFHILYIDLSKSESIKSTSEKIANKDPILFGRTLLTPTRYYYIDDWVDDYCDLTMEKFIKQVKIEDPEFSLSSITELNEESFERLKTEVAERVKKLEATNRDNWRDLVREEERKKLEEQLKPAETPEIPKTPRKKWWSFKWLSGKDTP